MNNKELSTSDFKDIFKKTNKDNPTKEDLKSLRNALRDKPGFWRIAGDMAQQAAFHMIEEIQATPVMKESLKTGWYEMQLELGGENPNPIERLLIQQVVISWIRLQIVDYKYTSMMNQSITLTLGRYWENRLNAAQRRHLRAVETLARVRRLLSRIPPFQVNIATQGGQQVNVAGDKSVKRF
jgi:hypothetical protein